MRSPFAAGCSMTAPADSHFPSPSRDRRSSVTSYDSPFSQFGSKDTTTWSCVCKRATANRTGSCDSGADSGVAREAGGGTATEFRARPLVTVETALPTFHPGPDFIRALEHEAKLRSVEVFGRGFHPGGAALDGVLLEGQLDDLPVNLQRGGRLPGAFPRRHREDAVVLPLLDGALPAGVDVPGSVLLLLLHLDGEKSAFVALGFDV